jgi:hypothetical protein
VLFAGGVSALLIRRGVEAGAEPLLLWTLGAVATLVAVLGVVALFGRLSLCCEAGRLVVHFGFLPLLREEIPLTEIASTKPVRYQPLRHFGGWGIRQGRYRGIQTALYALHGAKGVLLELREPIDTHRLTTDRILVGSQHPVELTEYLLTRIGTPQET